MNQLKPAKSVSFPLWLTAQKVKLPPRKAELVNCPLATMALRRYDETALSILQAPAGYGKSSLLAHWYEQLRRDGVQVCYLSLDAQDNDAITLANYLLYALYKSGINLDSCGIADFSLLQQLPLQHLLGLIRHVIELHQQQIVLILDNFHTLDSATIVQVVQPLLDLQAPNLHISIASRILCPLKISALELQDQVIQLNTTQLGFNKHQIKSFFNEDLPLKVLDYISELSDGWPIALRFLRDVLDTEQSLIAMQLKLEQKFNLFADYFTEQVTTNLNDDLMRQLMDMSISDNQHGALTNYLLEQQPYSPQLLAFIASNSPLIQWITKQPQNVRLNPLFRVYLQQRLEQEKPQRSQALHLVAAGWFSQQGLLKQAVEHCIKAGQPQQALDVIEQAGGIFMIWLKEGFSHLESVLTLLDQALQDKDPAIANNSMAMALFHCIVNTKSGNKQMAAEDFSAIVEQYERIKGHLSQSE